VLDTGYIVVWEGSGVGDKNIYARKIGTDESMQTIGTINDGNSVANDRVYPKISILTHAEYGGYIIAWIDEDENAIKLKRY